MAWSGAQRGQTWLASGLAVALALASVPAEAGPAGGEAATEAEPAADIGELWQQAQARIDTSDYEDAISLLVRISDAIALDPEAAALRLRVQWALHRAHVGAYGVDGDAEHLYVALDLLGKYLQQLPAGEADRRAEAEAAQAEVERQIEEHEAAERARKEAEAEAARQRAKERAEAAQAEAEAIERIEETRDEPPPETPPSSDSLHRGLVIGGAVGIGLGVAGLGLMAGGLGKANAAIGVFETDPDRRAMARGDVQTGNTMAIAGAAAGGVLLVGGAVLLALGLRRRAALRQGLTAGPVPLGVGWSARF